MTDIGGADIQADLQDYLNVKGINTLFIKIVENLLIEKPDNPIQFIVKYLQREYPDQCGALPQAMGGDGMGGGDDDDESSSEEEDDDEVADIPDIERKPAALNRRVSVSAESNTRVEANYQKKVIEKSAEESAQILKMASQSILLQPLDNDQLGVVKDAMFPQEFNDGDVIIKQGDDGDNYYLLDTGKVEVFVAGKGDDPIKTYSAGEGFGELALMYNAPRAATCKAVGKVKLWGLDRGTFKVILMDSTMKKRTLYKDFLSKVPILASLTEYEQLTIADSLVERSFDDGDTVCTQGEPGDSFYIVRRGVASCTQQDADGKVQEVARLEEGSYFGEIALLTQKPRQATVVAVGELSVLSMDRKTFKRVMGPLVDILNRNIGGYNKFMQQAI
jgi:cAMP-dependent protein kinase regulator